jgi:hypothetical protein
MVANRLAANGRQWTELFSQYNSGTYNNQWMITDYNLYHKGMSKLAPDTIWIAEQTPGMVKSFVETVLDMSSIPIAPLTLPFGRFFSAVT